MPFAKKLIVPTLCVLLGCAGGAAVGNVTAQTYPDNPAAQRWQQECVQGASGTLRDPTGPLNRQLAERGAQGWRAFVVMGNAICFERPAP